MPAESVLVRPARDEDLESVATIYRHYVLNSTATFEETPPRAEEWRRRYGVVRARRLPFLVAEWAGEVVGYAYCAPWRSRPAYRHTVEDSVYVAPQAVGRGAGRALLGGLLQGCREADVHQIIAVIADTGDKASAELHRRCGFAEAGRLSRVGHKHGQWLDTLLLQYSLPSP